MGKRHTYVPPIHKKIIEPYTPEPRLPEINFQRMFNVVQKKNTLKISLIKKSKKVEKELIELLEEIKDFVYDGIHQVVGILINEDTDEGAVECMCHKDGVIHPLYGDKIAWDKTIPNLEGQIIRIKK